MNLTGGELVFAPYEILTYGDTQVAFVGIDTPESIVKSTPAHFQNVAYRETEALIQSIQKEYEEKTSQVMASSEVLLETGDPDAAVRLIRSQETNLGDLCADAYRVMLQADIGWVNGGGIRAEMKPGDITYSDIIKVHPYGNMICLVEDRPADLRHGDGLEGDLSGQPRALEGP